MEYPPLKWRHRLILWLVRRPLSIALHQLERERGEMPPKRQWQDRDCGFELLIRLEQRTL